MASTNGLVRNKAWLNKQQIEYVGMSWSTPPRHPTRDTPAGITDAFIGALSPSCCSL